MEIYKTPSHSQRFELEIKRSRFISSIGSVAESSDAKAFRRSVMSDYPDANHHCWAVIYGAPDEATHQDQSDDGEPKGTAGKPMLNVLQHSQLGNTIVVVSRYFGGIKLGAGGLVRAYTRAVSDPLKTLETRTIRVTKPLTVELPYTALDAFEYWLSSIHTEVADKSFTDIVRLTLSVPASEKAMVLAKVSALGGNSGASPGYSRA